MRWVWDVVTDGPHTVVQEIDLLGSQKILLDGRVVSHDRSLWKRRRQHMFSVGAGHRARLNTEMSLTGRVTCQLYVNERLAQPLGGGPTAGWGRVLKEMPAWGWLFTLACAAIPVVTLGGAISGFIGAMGAGICATVSANRDSSLPARLAICTVTALGCWAALIGGVIGFTEWSASSVFDKVSPSVVIVESFDYQGDLVE